MIEPIHATYPVDDTETHLPASNVGHNAQLFARSDAGYTAYSNGSQLIVHVPDALPCPVDIPGCASITALSWQPLVPGSSPLLAVVTEQHVLICRQAPQPATCFTICGSILVSPVRAVAWHPHVPEVLAVITEGQVVVACVEHISSVQNSLTAPGIACVGSVSVLSTVSIALKQPTAALCSAWLQLQQPPIGKGPQPQHGHSCLALTSSSDLYTIIWMHDNSLGSTAVDTDTPLAQHTETGQAGAVPFPQLWQRSWFLPSALPVMGWGAGTGTCRSMIPLPGGLVLLAVDAPLSVSSGLTAQPLSSATDTDAGITAVRSSGTGRTAVQGRAGSQPPLVTDVSQPPGTAADSVLDLRGRLQPAGNPEASLITPSQLLSGGLAGLSLLNDPDSQPASAPAPTARAPHQHASQQAAPLTLSSSQGSRAPGAVVLLQCSLQWPPPPGAGAGAAVPQIRVSLISRCDVQIPRASQLATLCVSPQQGASGRSHSDGRTLDALLVVSSNSAPAVVHVLHLTHLAGAQQPVHPPHAQHIQPQRVQRTELEASQPSVPTAAYALSSLGLLSLGGDSQTTLKLRVRACALVHAGHRQKPSGQPGGSPVQLVCFQGRVVEEAKGAGSGPTPYLTKLSKTGVVKTSLEDWKVTTYEVPEVLLPSGWKKSGIDLGVPGTPRLDYSSNTAVSLSSVTGAPDAITPQSGSGCVTSGSDTIGSHRQQQQRQGLQQSVVTESRGTSDSRVAGSTGVLERGGVQEVAGVTGVMRMISDTRVYMDAQFELMKRQLDTMQELMHQRLASLESAVQAHVPLS